MKSIPLRSDLQNRPERTLTIWAPVDSIDEQRRHPTFRERISSHRILHREDLRDYFRGHTRRLQNEINHCRLDMDKHRKDLDDDTSPFHSRVHETSFLSPTRAPS